MTIGNIRIGLNANVNQLVGDFQKGERAVTRFSGRTNRQLMTTESRLNALTGAATRLRSALVTGLGTLGVGLGAGALTRSVRGVVGEVSELAKEARAVGVAFEDWQRIKFGFGQAGIEVSQITRGFEAFTQRIGEAAQEGGTLADVLQRNNIALRDQDGTLRPTLDLLRDYADLIANAASEAEAMNLAAEAFGSRQGRQMVRALRDGAAGVDELMSRADEAGVVLDERLAPAAERVDDRFDALSKQLATNFKAAVLTAVGAVDELLERFRELDNRSMVGPLQSELEALNAERDSLNRLAETQRQILAAAGDFGDAAAEQTLAAAERRIAEIESRSDQVLNRLGEITQDTRRRDQPRTGEVVTEIDDDTDARRRNAIATREQRDRAAELIAQLDHELSLLNATDVERAVANNLRAAGAEATAEQREEIDALTRALLEGEKANLSAAQAADFFGNTAYRAIDDLVVRGAEFEDVMMRVARAIASAALEAALLGSGPLADLFGGGGGGGIIGSILGAIIPSAAGNVIGGGRVMPFATGGVVGDTFSL